MSGVLSHPDTAKRLVLEYSGIICNLLVPVPCVILLLSFAFWLFAFKLFSYLRPIKFMTLPHESLATWLNCITVTTVIVVCGLEMQVAGSLCFPLAAHSVLKMETNIGFKDFEIERWLEKLESKHISNPIFFYFLCVMTACFIVLMLSKIDLGKTKSILRNLLSTDLESNNSNIDNLNSGQSRIQRRIKIFFEKTDEHRVSLVYTDNKTESKVETQTVEEQRDKRERFDLGMYDGLNAEDETETVPVENQVNSEIVVAEESAACNTSTKRHEGRTLDAPRKNKIYIPDKTNNRPSPPPPLSTHSHTK